MFSLVLTSLALLNATLASLIVIIGTIFSALILKSYLKTKNPQTLALAIMVFGSCSGWLTAFINYVLYFTGNPLLTGAPYVYITFIFLSLVFPSIVYAGISIVKPEQVKIWMIISIVLMLAIYIEVFIFLPLNIIKISDLTTIANSKLDNFPENSFNGFALIYIILSIIAGLIFGFLLIRFGLLSDFQLVRARGILIGSGLVLFSFFATVDTVFSTELIFGSSFDILIISRVFVMIGILVTYIGVTTPNFIKSYFNIPESTVID